MAKDKDRPDFTPGEMPPEVEEALKRLDSSVHMSPMEELGVFLVTTVDAYEEAGLNRNEALYMSAALITGNPGIAPKP